MGTKQLPDAPQETAPQCRATADRDLGRLAQRGMAMSGVAGRDPRGVFTAAALQQQGAALRGLQGVVPE
ncbi:hypothetical protein ACFWHL_36865 [Streptomyces massasporeus]